VKRVFPADATAVVSAGQLSTELGGEVVILGLQDSVYYGLSQVGTRIWQLLQTPHTLDQIVSVLVAEYDVTRERADADLQSLLADLHARGLIAINHPDGP
jgi:hypothetical protein